VTGTKTVKSSEIQVGDVVREHGMRVRIDGVTVHERQGSNGLTVYSCKGTVINLDEVLAAKVIPAHFLTSDKWVAGQGWVIDRRDLWTVQGNDLARWNVEA
jgi:hypothetical protein